MRDTVFIVMTMAIVWSVVFFALAPMGYPLENWALVASASVSAVIAGVLVWHGETVFENILLGCMLLMISGVISTSAPNRGFIFVCGLCSVIVGVIMNQINQAIANKLHRQV